MSQGGPCAGRIVNHCLKTVSWTVLFLPETFPYAYCGQSYRGGRPVLHSDARFIEIAATQDGSVRIITRTSHSPKVGRWTAVSDVGYLEARGTVAGIRQGRSGPL